MQADMLSCCPGFLPIVNCKARYYFLLGGVKTQPHPAICSFL